MSMLRVMRVGKDATCKLQKKLVLVSTQHPDHNTVIQAQHSVGMDSTFLGPYALLLLSPPLCS